MDAVTQIKINTANPWVHSHDQDFNSPDRTGIIYIVGIFNIYYIFVSKALLQFACRWMEYLKAVSQLLP